MWQCGRGSLLRLAHTAKQVCPASSLAAEGTVSRRDGVQMPKFVDERLSSVQAEIAQQFVSDVAGGMLAGGGGGGGAAFNSQLHNDLAGMAKYYFEQGGKMFRPAISLLMAGACNQVGKADSRLRLECGSDAVSLNQHRIAMIAEMIHTASLVHDDVIDEAATRRGNASVNAVWGNKMAVLVGDFILARATQILCSIGRPDVIAVMASIIEDLVVGEFMQMSASGAASERLDGYMEKTYRKTASLFANSCKSVALLAEGDGVLVERAEGYGKHLGLAFQLVDDMLDFVSSSETLGKPAASDLKLGLATAPVLFAAQSYPELDELMARKFSQPGDADRARRLVLESDGLERTRQLAMRHSQAAARLASELPNGDGVRDMLVEYALKQMDRRA